MCDAIHDTAAGEEERRVIDLDEIADAVAAGGERPAFYYAETSQQNDYVCDSCDDRNDILGRYGYCSSCATWNGLQELRRALGPIRSKVDAGVELEGAVRDTVSAFDSFARLCVQQLSRRVQTTPRRRKAVHEMVFHNLKKRAEELQAWFDIDLFKGISAERQEFAIRMFLRRHVYEHRGGEADEQYIRDSSDTSVIPKQALRETRESAGRTVDVVLRLAENLHVGFHEIFPQVRAPIRMREEQEARVRASVSGPRTPKVLPAT